MSQVIGRTFSGQAVVFEIDAHPVEADHIANAEAAIGSATVNAVTGSAGAATLNNAVSGTITTESVSTAAGTVYTFTLTSNLIKATSVVLANATLGTATTGTPCVAHITPAAGSVVIKVQNIHASAAFNGTLKIAFAIFQ